MDSSPTPGSAVPPGESLVADKLFGEKKWLKLLIEMVFLYGSLTRPPDVRSNTVCSWLLHSRSMPSKLRTLDIDDVLRHSELRNLHSQGENLNFVLDSSCLDLCGDAFYGSLLLDFLVSEVDAVMLMFLGGLHIIAPPYGDSLICFFAFEDAELVQRLSFFVRFSFGDIATILVAVDSRFIPLEIAILFSAFVLHSSCSSTSLMLLRKTEFQSHIHQLGAVHLI